jgi:hypothetical protein
MMAGLFLTSCQPEPPYREVVDLRELMLHVIEPAAEVYWDSVGTVMDLEGTHEIAPSNVNEWLVVENAAATVAEAGNLLLLPSRRRDDPRWNDFAGDLIDAGRAALEAADSRDPDAVFEAGGNLYFTCADCHAVFAPALLPANYREEE